MARQIRSLAPNTPVTVKFLAGYGQAEEIEEAVFLRLSEDGQRATFRTAGRSATVNGGSEWEAYRYAGAWCFGDYAGRISLLTVGEAPAA